MFSTCHSCLMKLINLYLNNTIIIIMMFVDWIEARGLSFVFGMPKCKLEQVLNS